MSNLGRKLIRWTYSEIVRLKQLHLEGKTRAEIALEMNMTFERVRQRLQWESQCGTLSVTRKRRRRISLAEERASPRGYLEPVTSGPKPSDDALRQRALRYATPPRSLTSLLCGDPLPGFSALERRA